jgi:superfamily II DNA helicase RecQ
LYLHYNEYYHGSLASDYLESLISEKKLARIIFDEAQTLVLWDEFTSFKQALPLIRTEPFPLVFLSGSASYGVLQDCIDLFSLSIPSYIFEASPRFNLKYSVTEQPLNTLKEIEEKERMIIFVSSRKKTSEAQDWLLQQNIPQDKIHTYHGEMSAQVKDHNQQQWIDTPHAIMIATSAFALGIDYPHVKYVYVVGTAYGLDNLIQMFGRAGRNNQLAECFYHFESHAYYNQNNKERQLLSDLEAQKDCTRYD